MDTQSVIHCPGCAGTRHRDLGEMRTPVEALPSSPATLRDMVSQTLPSRLLKCNGCGLAFRQRSLSPDQLCTLYENLPEKNWNYRPNSVGSWDVASKELEKLFRAQPTVRILDVGAFDGGFLAKLPGKYEKFAVEPNGAAAELLQSRGIKRLAAFLDDASLESERGAFDCITMLDVFEHLTRPQDSFQRIASLLKPGGMFLMSTGNTAHWTMKLLKGRHWYFHSIQHVCVPDIQTIAHYAKQVELRVVRSISHSHQLNSALKRFSQSIETLYWHLRFNGRKTRPLAALIQKLPMYRHLLHRTDSAKCDALHDHFLVVLQKLPDGDLRN
jgi:cyclopropane fatty-acyl-phospholipid synthase-like methyltransferase